MVVPRPHILLAALIFGIVLLLGFANDTHGQSIATSFTVLFFILHCILLYNL